MAVRGPLGDFFFFFYGRDQNHHDNPSLYVLEGILFLQYYKGFDVPKQKLRLRRTRRPNSLQTDDDFTDDDDDNEDDTFVP